MLASDENIVEYWLFPSQAVSVEDVMATVLTVVQDYIWNNEPLRLQKRELPIPHLYGNTCYADDVTDEWFIAHVLLQLTRAYPDLVVSVKDRHDGEFLLVEAAEVLPKWVSPETVENRVFLHQSHLHLIPHRKHLARAGIPVPQDWPQETPPSQIEGAALVRKHANITLAPEKVENEAFARIQGFPSSLQENHYHAANITLPHCLAALLTHRPTLVAPAVRAFCHRTSADLKACREMRHFPTSPLVLSRVRFTRSLYAQLWKQRFSPERNAGFKDPPSCSDLRRRAQWEMGVKLTSGFEMLACQHSSPDASSPFSPRRDTDPAWDNFRVNLARNGYFQGEIEGSSKHTALSEQALAFYRDQLCRNRPTPGSELLELLKDLKIDAESLDLQAENLPPDDDDSWLRADSSEYARLLKQAAAEQQINSTHDNTAPSLNTGIAAGTQNAHYTVPQQNVDLTAPRNIDYYTVPGNTTVPLVVNGREEGYVNGSRNGGEHALTNGHVSLAERVANFVEHSESDFSGIEQQLSTVDLTADSSCTDVIGCAESESGSSLLLANSTATKQYALAPTQSPESCLGTSAPPITSLSSITSSYAENRTSFPSTSLSQSFGCGLESGSSSKVVSPPSCMTSSKMSDRHSADFSATSFSSSVHKMLKDLHDTYDDEGSSDMDSYDDEDSSLAEDELKELEHFSSSMNSYMKQMDKELAGTTLSKSFVRKNAQKSPDSIDLEMDDFQPIDIDRNLVSNLLESYKGQKGGPGPASSLLEGLKAGVRGKASIARAEDSEDGLDSDDD